MEVCAWELAMEVGVTMGGASHRKVNLQGIITLTGQASVSP